jgi:hypothetical protein
VEKETSEDGVDKEKTRDCDPAQSALVNGESLGTAEPKPRWIVAIERWRALPPEERARIHREAIPRHVARSMAMEGECDEVEMERYLREYLATRRK